MAASLLTAVADSTNRPAAWATKLTLSGVPNFYQVSSNLYRGAQPTAEGMKQLKAMGIKTVINLREYHSEKPMVEGAGMKSVRFEMSPLHADEKAVVNFLQVVSDTNNWPVFFHCERGADRTGTMCAMYRITVCGWTKPEAIEEMKNGGYDFSPVWRNLVSFIEQADIEKIEREAGISSRVRPETRNNP